MPPKQKGNTKAKASGSKDQPSSPSTTTTTTTTTTTDKPPPPQTANEQSWQLYWATNPLQKEYETVGPQGMTTAQLQAYHNSHYVRPGAAEALLSKKAQKELWKQIADPSGPALIPPRKLRRPEPFRWGRDKHGRDLGDYPLDEYEARRLKSDRLARLRRESSLFRHRRGRARDARELGHWVDWSTGEPVDEGGEHTPHLDLTAEDVEAERRRRAEMATLSDELYGEKMGPYAQDPEWDDVAPMPQVEPEGALAAIAYPEDYAEAMSYLRAVMAAKEYSPRCLRLTDHVISMNPAHYTVWLYRFANVRELNISIRDEIAWLNEVSLEHLKNYQIWHHRQLLLDNLYPAIVTDDDDVAALARSETAFIEKMLALDTKNYHVWSYRQYLVRKLGSALWPSSSSSSSSSSPALAATADIELRAVEHHIDQDVRNNSAWSHRFFLVFADPGHTTPGSHATEPDPAVPADLVDRELAYARRKIDLAPQNQSPWNYLRGVLVKGARPLADARAFAEAYVENLGEGDEKERVRSSHALDLLADAYAQTGDRDRADLCLRRLAEKWDRVRRAYWEYRRTQLPPA